EEKLKQVLGDKSKQLEQAKKAAMEKMGKFFEENKKKGLEQLKKIQAEVADKAKNAIANIQNREKQRFDDWFNKKKNAPPKRAAGRQHP
ncbi:MAG TPA: hypothetical protein VF993_01585, partial [Myxococcales bacterium]